MMKLLPVGIADFEDLRQAGKGEPGYVYVDKTELIGRLVRESKYVFLSRPRRFGKSLLVSTLQCLFEGKRHLFDGLWVADQWEWAVQHLVVKIDFNRVMAKSNDLDLALCKYLDELAEAHGIYLAGDMASEKFDLLISQLYKQTGQKLVVLVDEYDKPITDFLGDLPLAERHRDLLRHFYVVLKGNEHYLRFVLFTGVSKIGKLSVFSGLNNLKDITLSPKYATLLGYTDAEVNHYFSDHLTAWATARAVPYDELRKSVANWYNGYSWGGEEKLYNPWSVLNALDDHAFTDHWYATGTPKFLIDGLKRDQVHLPDLEGYWTSLSQQSGADLDDLDVRALLWQTGYLTIKAVRGTGLDESEYMLGLPNYEVRKSLLVSYLADGWPHPRTKPRSVANKIRQALNQNELDVFFGAITMLLASIPYHHYQQQNEAFYHAVVHTAVALSGHVVASEVAMATGRIDAVVEAPRYIYVFEFKLTTPEEALGQIKANNYAAPYMGSGKTVMAVAAAFDAEARTLKGWLSEQLA